MTDLPSVSSAEAVSAGPVENTASPAVASTVESAATDPVLDEFQPIVLDSQDAVNSFVKKRVERAKRSAEEAMQAQIAERDAKIKAFEEQALSESEKVLKRAEAAEKLAQERDAELARLKRDKLVSDLASEAKLPKKLWDRIRGDTEEDIQADIEDLAKEFGTDTVSTDSRPPSSRPKTVSVVAPGHEPETTITAKSVADRISKSLIF